MFLKRLEIKGFKSFANRVKVDFEPAVTGVIGPNGSGKSNISDAIRWVLGEQSAKTLRGAKMKDVIFAGSNKKKPLGMAEVFLTLNNSDGMLPIDYNEVTIGRRVNRSGESEYLINNNKARLKDIQELFWDTGVGKDAYSIIGQGKVEAVLSRNSADRRELFEEAAGITKHKNRKEEAVNKLENTESKLQRIEDIINEIKRQVGPLEEEAKKAKEYKKSSARLEKLEVNLLLNKYKRIKDNLDNKMVLEKKLSCQVTEAKAGVGEYDLKIDSNKESLDEVQRLINEQKENLFNAKSGVERIESKLQLAHEKKLNLLKEESRLEDEIERLSERIKLNKEEKEEKIDNNLRLKEELNKRGLILHNKEKKLEEINQKLKELTSKKEGIKNNQVDQINEINNQQYKLKTISNEVKRYQSELERLKSNQDKIKDQLAKTSKEKLNKEEKLDQIEDELVDSKKEKEQNEESKQRLNKELSRLQNEYNNLQEDLANKQSRLNVLQGMQESYEGYYRGVKKLMKYVERSNNLQGVCGVVAELIETPKEYERAIEVALGSILQNIIVEDDQVGKRAINYLKSNKAGRATFLPLNLVTSRSLRKNEEKALQVDGALGVAKDLIDYDDKYQSVIENVLGRVIVVSQIDAAVEVSKAANKRVKVVTLDGDIINPGGAMTGGSRSNKNNLLGRSREIQELKNKVDDQKRELKEVKELGLKKRERLLSLEEELGNLGNNIHQLELERTGFNKDWQQIETEIKRLRDELKKNNDEYTTIEVKKKELKYEKEEILINLEELSDDGSSLKEVIANLEEEIISLEGRREECNSSITELRVKLAALKQENEQLIEDIEARNKTISQIKSEIKVKEEKITNLKEKRKRLKDRVIDLKNEKEKMATDVLQLKEELDRLRREKRESNSKIQEFQRESKDIRRKLERLNREYNEIEVEVARLKVRMDNIIERLEEYDLEPNQIEMEEEIVDYSGVEDEIKKLKDKLKSLEPVNLGAVEEYQSLSQRFNFLKEQHYDLVESKEALQQVIDQIDGEMKEKFLDSFKQVKKEFEIIFADLFEGGEAQLVLEDKDDLLKTGIEINAQPPGKKLQKLSLMSGGEKALTATALIFALLKVNPSPFYVLDELDAPLDDANVNRFASYLNKLSSMTQFIVITHRKGTMEAVDALYGVTMQESGISQLVSLKLDEMVG